MSKKRPLEQPPNIKKQHRDYKRQRRKKRFLSRLVYDHNHIDYNPGRQFQEWINEGNAIFKKAIHTMAIRLLDEFIKGGKLHELEFSYDKKYIVHEIELDPSSMLDKEGFDNIPSESVITLFQKAIDVIESEIENGSINSTVIDEDTVSVALQLHIV